MRGIADEQPRDEETGAKASNALAAAHQDGCRGKGEGGKGFQSVAVGFTNQEGDGICPTRRDIPELMNRKLSSVERIEEAERKFSPLCRRWLSST